MIVVPLLQLQEQNSSFHCVEAASELNWSTHPKDSSIATNPPIYMLCNLKCSIIMYTQPGLKMRS